MVIFILDLFNLGEAAVRGTSHHVKACIPDAVVIVAESGQASLVLNETLRSPESMGEAGIGEYFITVVAGELFSPALLSLAEGRLESGCAGVAAPEQAPGAGNSKPVPRGPFLWRREACFTGEGERLYFASREKLPFECYVLLEMQLRLGKEWTWTECALDMWTRHPVPPKWHKSMAQWTYMEPLLSARSTYGITPVGALPYFSIVLCFHNDISYLSWSIQSVMRQSFPNWELILMDDGSTESSDGMMRDYGRDVRVRMLRSDRNEGKAASLNKALIQAQGSYLLELDADDWLDPACLSVLHRTITSQPDLGMVYADHILWKERPDGQPVFHQYVPAMASFSALKLLRDAIPLAPRCYRIEALRSLGGWWEHGPGGGRLYEDFQMMARLAGHYTVERIPEPLYHRRLREDSVSASHTSHYAEWRDWFSLFVKPLEV
ncbi:glycosyltransferase family 2 protein [Paenibacillus swuensis]|uniref:glycosyltransferase family 2 protein n=1 Tax=Paenibacillus swuensis TaxID=1178515 RepID=UPI0008381A3C|nr:glycosyltransferase family 2 protein [Paenibacillus swuensis]